MKIGLLMWLIIFVIVIGISIPGCSGAVSTESPLPGSPSTAVPSPQSAPVSQTVSSPAAQPPTISEGNLKLPEPRLKSEVSLEEALFARRSIRQYADAPLSLSDISQLLWAAQGITDSSGKRTAPSAMATYPLEIYLVAGNVEGLAAGVYLYVPSGHELMKIKDGDVRKEISRMPAAQNGAIDIVITGNLDKFARFGDNGIRFICLEAGHAAQNICLQATALNLGTVTTAGFSEEQVKTVLGITGNKTILYIMPAGKKI